MYRQVLLTADPDVRILALRVCQQIEDLDDRPIARILNWNDSKIEYRILNASKDVGEGYNRN